MQKYHKEKTNQNQGKTGAKVKMIKGPATAGNTSGNPTKSGGIFRPTKKG